MTYIWANLATLATLTTWCPRTEKLEDRKIHITAKESRLGEHKAVHRAEIKIINFLCHSIMDLIVYHRPEAREIPFLQRQNKCDPA